jgi:DNA polymerase-3 subunit delta
MLAFEFLRNPEKPGPKPIYAVVGEDAYLRRETLTAIIRVALGAEADDLAVSRYPGESAALADVLDEVRTLPFLSRARVAIVEGADPFVTAHRKELEAYAESPAVTGVLVLAVKAWPANTKLAKLVDKVGLAVDCKSPSERELPGWLVELARAQYDLRLESDASRLLLELVGPKVGLLVSDLEKLAIYVGDRKTIKSEDVSRMVGAGRIESVWAILDAAATGSSAEALGEVDRLIASGEHPVGLRAAMSTSLRKVHHAGQLRLAPARLHFEAACDEAGIPPYAVEKTRRQHAHLGPIRVARLPEMLLRADLDLKGFSQLPPRTVLERFLVELARPRAD